jgi:tetratricopeptide (TPR) repeat protein
MRTFIVMLIAITALGLACYALPTDSQQSATAMKSMSVADLEKAGDAARAQKDYAQAIEYFTQALKQDKKNAKLYNKRGLAELSIANYPAARADFTKATKCNRNYPEAWNDLGVVLYVEKKYPEAVKKFGKAISLADDKPSFHVNLGVVYFAQGNVELAMQQYTRALQLDPDALMKSSNTAMSAQILDRQQRAAQDYMMARIYAKLGEVDRCLKCLEKAKENGYTDMGNVYKDEDFSKVRQDARLATIVPPPAPQK